MFERYLERARRALFFARYEASQLGSISIEPPHLLLGIFREGTTVTAALLAQSRLSADALRSELAALVAAPAKSTSVEIPFAPDTKRALTNAAEEADRFSAGTASPIDSDHLLLGVLALGGPSAAVFEKHGIALDAVRRLVAQQRYDPAPVAPPQAVDRQPDRHRELSEFAPDLMFDVRVMPSRSSEPGGSTHGTNHTLNLENLDLYSVIREAAPDMPMSRIEVDSTVDEKVRWDVRVRCRHLTRERRSRLVREGLEVALNATLQAETRNIDVYVVTAGPDARERLGTPRAGADGGGFGSVGIGTSSVAYSVARSPDEPRPDKLLSFGELRKFMSRGFIGGVSMDGSIEMFGHLIEDVLGRPVVDETGLKGTYNIQIPEARASSHDEFFERVREHLGLIVTPARRDVTFIVLRKN